MKNTTRLLPALIVFLAIRSARASTLTWTNIAGGNWSTANNWSPNQVPVNGDDVTITNGGTYTVTNNTTVTLDNLTLGGTNGTQTLIMSSLTLTNLGLVNSNGILNWNGGDLEGAMTVAQGGTLIQSNTLTFALNNYSAGAANNAYLTNAGTVVWAGTIQAAGNASSHGGGGTVYNSGSWNAVANMTIGSYNGVGTNLFINAGTLQIIGATGTSTINWNFSNNDGTINSASGSFTMGNWIGNGAIHGNATFLLGTITGTLASNCVVTSSATITGSMIISSNAVANWTGGDVEGSLTVAQGGTLTQSNTLQFVYNNYLQAYTNTGYLTNYGTVIWAGIINASANGTTHGGGGVIYNAGLWNAVADQSMGVNFGSGTNYFINAGTLEKTAATGTSTIGWNFSSSGMMQTYSGTFNLNWGGPSVLNGNVALTGTIAAPLTVASNAVLSLSSTVDLESALTVAQGATLIQSNTLHFAYNNYSLGYTNTAYLTNYGTVIWTGSIDAAGNSSTYGGGGIIYNASLWNDVGDLSMGSYNGAGTNYFINAGTLEKTAGGSTSTIGWDLSSSGIMQTYSGTFNLNWGGPSVLNGNVALTGTIAAPLTIASNAVLSLSSTVDLESALIVAQGATLVQSNTLHFAYNNYALGYTNTAYLTNYGTVTWAGSIDGSGNSSTHGGGGIIYNAGLWNAVADLSMGSYNGAGTNYFINVGTLEKTAASGTSTIGWNFDSESGTLETVSGNFTFNGIWTPTSLTYGNATISQNIGGTIGSNAVIAWLGGDLEGALTVAQGGTLMQSNTVHFAYNNYALGYTNTVYLTNDGTVMWAGSIDEAGNSSTHGGGGIIYNAGLWNAVADLSMGSYNGVGSNIFINTGTLEKAAGSGTSTIAWTVVNSGVVGSQTNTLSLTGNYDLSAGTLNCGINGAGNCGNVHLSGSPATLAGSVSANLNNGYVPIGGNSFTNIYYSSFTGAFTNTVLPFADAWSTNYTTGYFVLNVLNARPVMVAPTTNRFVVKELTALNVTNTATDADVPAQLLSYSIVGGFINGMAVDSTTGIFTWTPQQTNSPATNIVAVAVTDNGNPPLSATNIYTVIVQEVNVPPSLPAISTQTVNELTLLTVVNTATNFNIHSTNTGYALVNPPNNMAISASGVITWTPAQTQSPGAYLITTIVTNSNPYDLVNPVLTSTNQFTVNVKEVNVAPSLPAVSTQSVNELTLLTVTNTATNFNIHSSITGYTLVNPPSNMVISASGIITWTPAQAQSPSTNVITTIVSNSNPYDTINPVLTSTNQFTAIVKEVNVAPSLPAISTQSVNELTLLTVTNTATNANIHSTITGYALVNPPSNMVVSASGIITWTPAQAQSPSTNVITTIVTNSNPYDLVNPVLTSTNQFTAIVIEVNVAPVLPVIPTQTINALALLTVTNTAAESNIHASVGYALVSPPTGVSISPSGVITWTPSRAQGPGTNVIITVVTNTDSFDTVHPHLSATNSFTVIIYAPTLNPIGNYTVNPGQTVTFTATATDNDPTRILTFSLVTPPAGATIGSASGLFNWRPGVATANTTNAVQVTVTDNSIPALSDTKSFTVTVNPLAPVVLVPLGYTNGQFKFQINGTTGPDYIIMAGSAVTAFNDVATNVSPATPFQFTDTNAISATNHFYRVRLAP
jgi:hypothetical protein